MEPTIKDDGILGEDVEKPVKPQVPAPAVEEEDPYLFDMPEIPMADTGVKEITVGDEFKVDPAVKFSFLGVGQGGSRIVECFWNLGYRRCAVVNTAKQDLDEIHIHTATEDSESRKLWLGVGGAAKNRRLGGNYMDQNAEEILELMRNSYGTSFDRIIVCATAGGGTGSGGFKRCVEVANQLTEALRIRKVGDKTKVGLILALPSNSERDRMQNAYESLKEVEALINTEMISPVVIVDNEKRRDIHPSATLGNVRDKLNQSITTLFHLFNQISQVPTRHTAFDPGDYLSVLESGLVTYGAMQIEHTDKEGISQALRENLKKNVLGGMDLKTAEVVACILMGQKMILENIPFENIEHAYEMVSRTTGCKKIHRGEYTSARALEAYTILGGLDMPAKRLKEIAKMAGHTDWDE